MRSWFKTVACALVSLVPLSLAVTGTTMIGPHPVYAASSIYVSTIGNDLTGDGSEENPYRTINHAAQLAVAGDHVIIRGGVYRETIQPVNGGTSDENRITYQAYEGESVVVKGSNAVYGWQQDGTSNVWKVTFNIHNYFGDYNPYGIALLGYKSQNTDVASNRTLGEVYLDGVPLSSGEQDDVNAVYTTPNSWRSVIDNKGDGNPLNDTVTIYANFGGETPALSPTMTEHVSEINVREQMFTPATYNLGYVTLKNITFEHSANQFPYKYFLADDNQGFPESPQHGAVSIYGGHDWIIEGITVNYAKTVGIDIGYGGYADWVAAGYTGTGLGNIYSRMVEHGSYFGKNIVRNNVIKAAGSTGILGAVAPFSQISGNRIDDTGQRPGMNITYPTTGGIKVLTAIDTVIEHNLIRNSKREAIWLDNTDPGVRITRNILINNPNRGLFSEMGYGPVWIDNNILINSQVSIHDSGGNFLVHNLFYNSPQPDIMSTNVRTPIVYEPHTMTRLGNTSTTISGNKFYNNLFFKKGLTIPAEVTGALYGNDSNWNAFVDGATKSPASSGKTYDADSRQNTYATGFNYTSDESGIQLDFNMNATPFNVDAPYMTPDFLGAIEATGAKITDAVSTDFFGNPIDPESVIPGPFANLAQGGNHFSIWSEPLVESPPGGSESMVIGKEKVTDSLNDWSHVYSHSGNTILSSGHPEYYDGDLSRATRNSTDTGDIVYSFDEMIDFAAKIYYNSTSVTPAEDIKFYTSADEASWTPLSTSHTTPVASYSAWRGVTYFPDGRIPAGVNYLKIEFSSSANGTLIQLAEISIG